MSTWKIGDLMAEQGTKVHGYLKAPGLENPMPAFLIHGETEGPTALVLGGIHGCEYSSIDAALQLGRTLVPKDVKGRVVVIPIANPDSFYARSIYVHPSDRKNLNRCFPGRADGSEAEQLAHFLFNTVMQAADHVIEALVPFSIYHVTGKAEQDESALDLARTFGIPYVIASQGQVPGSTYGAAAGAGKLAMIAEAGQQGILNSDSSLQLQRGVRNVLAKVGILDAPVERTKTAVLNRFDWYRAEEKGLWYPTVQVGDRVNEGQTLGVIKDEFGEPVGDYRANTDGTVLFLVTSLAINVGDPLLAIGDA